MQKATRRKTEEGASRVYHEGMREGGPSMACQKRPPLLGIGLVKGLIKEHQSRLIREKPTEKGKDGSSLVAQRQKRPLQ